MEHSALPTEMAEFRSLLLQALRKQGPAAATIRPADLEEQEHAVSVGAQEAAARPDAMHGVAQAGTVGSWAEAREATAKRTAVVVNFMFAV
jgi:hypothetical protein